jgi:hypothetical protein
LSQERIAGVGDRARTGDHLSHSQGLCQLNYSHHRLAPILRTLLYFVNLYGYSTVLTKKRLQCK